LKKSPSRLRLILATLTTLLSLLSVPLAAAQSPEADAEWALFNQILTIGIVVGMVVFGLMFYAIIRYRERPQKGGAN
jgi:heme/copper-type cytochrome/quinol oxidase subunit 2